MNHLHPVIMAEVERAVADHPDSLITLINPGGVFLYASPSAEHLLGWKPEDVLGRPFMEYVEPADINHLMLAVQDAMLNDRSVDVSMRARKKSGGYQLMRGYSWKLIDPTTDEILILARAEILTED
jgi:PAS domain S-box-containing protein